MSTLITPRMLQATLPLPKAAEALVLKTRQAISHIMDNKEDRLLVVVGPCSIHHADSALLYAEKLQTEIKKHADTLCIVMRAYIEKARTALGWKGYVNDPHLNNSFAIEEGLHRARELLMAINTLGTPTGSEILNPLTMGYFSDTISWATIGARTTESPVHRELASHLPMPVGFKNNTSGDITVAIDAMETAQKAHYFLHPNLSGEVGITRSSGNPYTHIVLRGANTHTNYDRHTVSHVIDALQARHLNPHVMIDCSHGNSGKDYTQQRQVLEDCIQQLTRYRDRNIFGVMLESHLLPGKQTWTPHQPMRGTQSITDACMGWEETVSALQALSVAVQIRRENMVQSLSGSIV